MSGTYTVTMGDRGRIVVPAEVRMRSGITEGTPLVLVESDDGLILLTRKQLRDRVRKSHAETDLVGGLLLERRRRAAEEDRAGEAEPV